MTLRQKQSKCDDCLAELSNRAIALGGAAKHNNKAQLRVEQARLEAHVIKMELCKTGNGKLKYDPTTKTI